MSSLPGATVVPTNSNHLRALFQAQLVNTFPENVVNTSGASLTSGTYVVPSNSYFRSPAVLTTVRFSSPFLYVPIVHCTVNNYGNTPPWIIHVRNVTSSSFDLVLTNADKLAGVSFAIIWNAISNPIRTVLTTERLDLINTRIENCPSLDGREGVSLLIGAAGDTVSTVVGRGSAITNIQGNVLIHGSAGGNGTVLASDGTTASWITLPAARFPNVGTSGLDMADFPITNCASVDNTTSMFINGTSILIGTPNIFFGNSAKNNGAIVICKPLTLDIADPPSVSQKGYTFTALVPSTAPFTLSGSNVTHTIFLSSNTIGVWGVTACAGIRCTANGTLTYFSLYIQNSGLTVAMRKTNNVAMTTTNPTLTSSVSAIVYGAPSSISLVTEIGYEIGSGFSTDLTNYNFSITRIA